MSYQIKSRIWIEFEEKTLLGKGRVDLLKAIDETGSLSKAAKSLNLSYKKAWHLTDSVNKTAKKPVIETSTGGKDGGGTQLTPYGKSLIRAFDEINTSYKTFLDNQLNKITSL